MNSLKMNVTTEMHGVSFAQQGNDNLVCREYLGQPVTSDRHVSLIFQIENPLRFKSVTRLSRGTDCSKHSPIAEVFNQQNLENGLTELLIRQCKWECSVCFRALPKDKNQSVEDNDWQLTKLFWQSQNSQTALCTCTALSECFLIAKVNSLIANFIIVEFSHMLIAKLCSLIAILVISDLCLAINQKSMSFSSCIDITSCKNCLANQERGERRPDWTVWLLWLQLRDDWFSGGHVFMSHRCIKKLFNFTSCVVFCANSCKGKIKTD